MKGIKEVKIALVLSLSFFLTGCDILKEVLESGGLPMLTSEEIGKGLKEALKVGTNKSVSALSKTDGFYGNKLLQIALPKEANTIVKNVSKIPLLGDKVVEETKKMINRSAEDAASQAGPIFKNAITSMSISDAVGILKGRDTAATNYLRRKTFSKLQNAFTPKIKGSLGKKIIGNNSAESAYSSLIGNYNKAAKLPFSGLEQIKTNSLSKYVTRRALNGLFHKVKAEEKNIRDNPGARVNDLLKKVFSEENRNRIIR